MIQLPNDRAMYFYPHEIGFTENPAVVLSANVLFFERKEASEKPWTQDLWIYDLDHGKEGGTYFKGEDRPTLETVFPRRHESKKKYPRI
jgi:hypothetical protein